MRYRNLRTLSLVLAFVVLSILSFQRVALSVTSTSPGPLSPVTPSSPSGTPPPMNSGTGTVQPAASTDKAALGTNVVPSLGPAATSGPVAAPGKVETQKTAPVREKAPTNVSTAKTTSASSLKGPSRFAFLLEAVPGVTKRTLTNSEGDSDIFQGYLSGNLGFGVYALTLCHNNTQGFCADLMIHLRAGAGYLFESQASYFNLFLGADGIFFFGKQRWVGLLLRVGLGYQRYLSYGGDEQGVRSEWKVSSDGVDQFVYSFGPGLFINLDPVVKGLNLYVNTEFYRTSSFIFPIGIQYRF